MKQNSFIPKTLRRFLRTLGEGENSASFTETERSRAPSISQTLRSSARFTETERSRTPSISQTLRSSARFTETERSRAPSISQTLRSSARFTENERSRATSSIALILSLLLISPCLAWDDEEFDSNPSHQLKIQHQESKITSTSFIDYGGPKRLAEPDDDDSRPFSQSRIKNPESRITLTTVQESIAVRDRASKELLAESQRRFDKQEADQERSRAQMAKQQSIYDEMDREECEMAEFLGGVYKAKFGATTGRNSAVTTEGYVFRSGNNFVTPRGIYSKDGNVYAGPDGITTQTGDLFFGTRGTTIQAGGAYFSEGKSGYIVAPNCRNTFTWRSR